MSDVNFTIGGTPAPFMSAMDQVKAKAKESAESVTESFGIEGVKSERALHSKITGAFKDITKGGTDSAAAIGGAFENLTEGLRLSMGSMIALLAVSELVKSMYAGYQAASKMKDAVKDALSIDMDVTNQSVEEVGENIKKLKADADANNLAAMGSLEAGAIAVVHAFEEGKSVSEVVREDAEKYHQLMQEAHDMQDEQDAKLIENANAVLALKVAGHDKEAEALAHEQEMQEKLRKAEKDKNEDTISALNQEISLEDQLAEKEQRKASKEKEDKLDELRSQVYEEQMNRGSDADKLKFAHEKTEHAKTEFAHADAMGTDPVAIEKARLDWEKAITAEKNVQKAIDTKHLEEMRKGNEQDAEQKKKQEEAARKALEHAEERTKLLLEQKEAQQAVGAAQLDSTMFHGVSSSLAKTGLGGRVSGANYGNQAQLKAAQDAAKHLAEINAAFKKFQGQIGVAN